MSNVDLGTHILTRGAIPSFAFLIDNRKCIGCHACTTACKSENEVPLGVNRTWVKYTDKGIFPDTRRYFQVTRCNHCANPPCVTICPTRAMFQRPDGIVEFDGARCIGCKACMQACPYDAIYIDPDSHTAAKCHYCAHRTDVGLEPACVVVCPVHAILAGDMNDPGSELSRALATQQVRVRKPEQGTKPKLFYIDAEEASIVPTLAAQDGGMLWATLPASEHTDWRGPLKATEGRMAGALIQSAAGAREVYNVPHRVPWHWQVPAYLVTKAIGTGMFLLVAPVLALGGGRANAFALTSLFLSLIFIAVTTGLLVADLDRPERFWTILTRPQWRSWLTRGAFILAGFSALGGVFFLGHLLDAGDWVNWLAWPASVLALLSAVYTAFLFAQAEGRDLWQSTLLPWHLFVQALMCGSGFLLLLAPAFNAAFPSDVQALWPLVFGASLVVNLMLTLGGEFAVPHASQVAAVAAHMITHGRYRRWYWAGIVGGLLLPLALALFAGGSAVALAIAGVLAIAGLFAYEWAFVMAPQQVPNN
jgi:Fe-S-cluster-containing dehydrogenase component/formate-dependent nitrite reductase membrane component NrfD